MTDVIPLRRLVLYDDPWAESLAMPELLRYLGEHLPRLPREVQGEFFTHWLVQQDTPERLQALARQLAAARVHQVDQPFTAREPLFGEMAYEERRLQGQTKASGVLYDGFEFAAICRTLLPPDETRADCLHIVFSNQLLGTFSEDDRRYHARTTIFGVPVILSMPGYVEAPARPPEFYVQRQLGAAPVAESSDELPPYLIADDPRLTEVVKSGVMQAIAFATTGHPFCDDPACRLFNAHRQKDLLRPLAETGPEFCPRHEEWLDALRDATAPGPGI